jgi:hypothetical protein
VFVTDERNWQYAIGSGGRFAEGGDFGLVPRLHFFRPSAPYAKGKLELYSVRGPGGTFLDPCIPDRRECDQWIGYGTCYFLPVTLRRSRNPAPAEPPFST